MQPSSVAADAEWLHQNLQGIFGKQKSASQNGCLLVTQGAMVNYFQAHKLLDEVKDGIFHTFADITAALELTGDLDFE